MAVVNFSCDACISKIQSHCFTIYFLVICHYDESQFFLQRNLFEYHLNIFKWGFGVLYRFFLQDLWQLIIASHFFFEVAEFFLWFFGFWVCWFHTFHLDRVSFKNEWKRWSLSKLWLTGEVTFQAFRDVLADVESNSIATRVHLFGVAVWGSEKGLKQFGLLEFWNSYATVYHFDRYVHLIFFNYLFQKHKNLISLLREFRCVRNQVDKDLLHSLKVYSPVVTTSKVSKLNVKNFGWDLPHHCYNSPYGFNQVVDAVVDGKHIVLKQFSVE